MLVLEVDLFTPDKKIFIQCRKSHEMPVVEMTEKEYKLLEAARKRAAYNQKYSLEKYKNNSEKERKRSNEYYRKNREKILEKMALKRHQDKLNRMAEDSETGSVSEFFSPELGEKKDLKRDENVLKSESVFSYVL